MVKTKGRLNANGTVTSGQRLTGATIAVLNGNRVVSGANGKFALMLPSAKFVLESVTKKNYILADPDFLRKQYEYSTNDFIIVMEDELEKANERRKIEKQARSSLYAQTEKQREEINRLKQPENMSLSLARLADLNNLLCEAGYGSRLRLDFSVLCDPYIFGENELKIFSEIEFEFGSCNLHISISFPHLF